MPAQRAHCRPRGARARAGERAFRILTGVDTVADSMPAPPSPPTPARRPGGGAHALLLLGTLGFAAAWVTLSLTTGRTHAWMAVLAALDAALLLRLGRWPAGAGRALAGFAAWSVIVALATWLVIAGHLGKVFGLAPWTSALRLGADHAWTLAGLAFTPVDLAWLAAGAVVALAGSR